MEWCKHRVIGGHEKEEPAIRPGLKEEQGGGKSAQDAEVAWLSGDGLWNGDFDAGQGRRQQSYLLMEGDSPAGTSCPEQPPRP